MLTTTTMITAPDLPDLCEFDESLLSEASGGPVVTAEPVRTGLELAPLPGAEVPKVRADEVERDEELWREVVSTSGVAAGLAELDPPDVGPLVGKVVGEPGDDGIGAPVG